MAFHALVIGKDTNDLTVYDGCFYDPHGYERNKKSSKHNQLGLYQECRNSIYSTLVYRWDISYDEPCYKTIKEDIRNEIFKSIKGYINHEKSTLITHDGPEGYCLLKGPHIHIIIPAAMSKIGEFKSPFNGTKYQKLRNMVVDDGGYCSSCKIRDINDYLKKLISRPSYRGTRNFTMFEMIKYNIL